MKIAFVSTYDARNVSNWSGLGYFISKSLEDNGNDLDYIGELGRKITIENLIKKIYFTRIRRKKFALERTVAMAKGYAEVVAASISGKQFDCIFSPGSIPIAYLKTPLPKVIYTDATFASMLNYYEPASTLSADIIRQGHEIEKEALESCSLAIYCSEWAAESAINYYKIDPAKVKVVPFGANLDKEYSESEVHAFINDKDRGILKILFNGVDFVRKGGDLVLSAVTKLKDRGLQVQLHIVGIPELPITRVPDFVVNHGYLQKGDPVQKALLEDLYKTCHFLFLPSRAEAFGCVFCEASSFGMPSISRKTGGVTSAIINGVNGFTLEENASVDDYVDLISHFFLDKEKLAALSMSSFREYQNRLNWKSAGASITGLISRL